MSAHAASLYLQLPAVRIRRSSPGLRRAAQAASRRQPVPTRTLDVQRTLRKTIRRGGFFAPIYRARRVSPEYLFLVHQVSDLDLEYDRVRARIGEMRDQGVLTSTYPYRVDPREVQDTLAGDPTRPIGLEVLQQRHPDSRLVVVGTGREMVNPFTFRPLRWTSELRRWARRAFVTPLPSADWGTIEGVLHRQLGFSVASSRERGLEALAELLGGTGPVALRSDPGEARREVTPLWVVDPSPDYVLERLLGPGEEAGLLSALRLHLGPEGFLWLGVCAHFPAMAPPIALALGRSQFGAAAAEPAFAETFARLASLPWMRHGSMPYWARELVRSALLEPERARAADIAAGVLAGQNFTARPGRVRATGLMGGAGDAPIVLPLRVGPVSGGEGGLEVDELTIAWFVDRGRAAVDPILSLTPEQVERLLKEVEPEVHDVEDATVPERETSVLPEVEVHDVGETRRIAGGRVPRIFISYARKDGEAVEEIRTAFLGLAQDGHVSVFKDDRTLTAGDDWQTKLWGALGDADVVLACLSRHYFASWNCRAELDEALAQGVLVLPCIVSECDYVPHPVHDLQRAARGASLAEVWADGNGRAVWLGQLVRDVLQAIQQGGLTAEGDELDAVDPELVAAAFELAGRLAPADPVAGLRRLRRTDPAAAGEVKRRLAELTGGAPSPVAAPPPRPSRGIALTPVAVEPAAPKKSELSSPWTQYWRNRLGHTVPWSTLTGHAARAELSDGDRAYLVVGEPAQEPHLLVSRIRSLLPGSVSDEPRRPAVVVVPFPDPDLAATDAYDVQRQLSAALCEHPEFPDLHPAREPRCGSGKRA